jgi:L-amino acid N-acyltransferase YncA
MTKAKTSVRKELRYRPSTKDDDLFIARVTLHTMKQVFEDSTKQPLTEEIILQLVKATDHVVIIEKNGKPIGYYCYYKTAPDRIYWGSLILLPVKQAQGLGNMIVDHFVTEARKQGVKVIDGHVQVKNERACRFWLKNGFQVVGPPQAGSYPIQLRLDEATGRK